MQITRVYVVPSTQKVRATCMSISGWINKCAAHMQWNGSHLKNEILAHITTWKNLEDCYAC